MGDFGISTSPSDAVPMSRSFSGRFLSEIPPAMPAFFLVLTRQMATTASKLTTTTADTTEPATTALLKRRPGAIWGVDVWEGGGGVGCIWVPVGVDRRLEEPTDDEMLERVDGGLDDLIDVEPSASEDWGSVVTAGMLVVVELEGSSVELW